jgi:hypothetical protein
MCRVRGVVHGPAAGLIASKKGGRSAREATLDLAATSRPFFFSYSPECVEGQFCELRLDGVLRSSAIIENQDVGKGPSRVQPFLRLTPWRVFLSAFRRMVLVSPAASDTPSYALGLQPD